MCFKERREKGLHSVFDLWKNFAEELKEDLVVPMSTRNAGRESFPSSSSSLSPGVAVCIFLLLVIKQLDIDMHVILQVHVGYKIPRLTSSQLNARNLGGSGKKKPQARCNGMHEKLKFFLACILD